MKGLYTVIQNFVHPRLLVKGDESNPAEYFSREQPYFTDTPYHVILSPSLFFPPFKYHKHTCSIPNRIQALHQLRSLQSPYNIIAVLRITNSP